MTAAEIASRLQDRRDSVLTYLFPSGRKVGAEFCVGSLNGEPGDSLKVKVNGDRSPWSDFATGESGGDLLDLWAKARHRGDVGAAMREAGEWLGERPAARARTTRGAAKAAQVRPVPTDAPDPPAVHPELGEPLFKYEYSDQDGRPLGYVYRFEPKTFRPLTLWRTGDRLGWQWRAFEPPAPLFGLADLAVREFDPVLVHEGEKAAEAAREHLPDFVHIAWPGGCQTAHLADWAMLAGRNVTLLPDADPPGERAMQAAARRIVDAGAAGVRIAAPLAELGEGADVANIETPEHVALAEQKIAEARPFAPEPATTDAPLWTPANTAYRSARLEAVHPISYQGRPVPPRDWIVPGWIPQRQTTLIYGDGGLGKTILGLQLATACATGCQWLGLDVLRCRALVVAAEDEQDELHRRQADINAALGVNFSDLGDLIWLPRIDAENSLMMFERFEKPAPTEFSQQLIEAARDFAARLVFLDSLHDFFDGEENVRTHARRFIKLLTAIARAIDGAVVMTAHPSLEGLKSGTGTAGNTAWSNACRSRLYLRRPADTENDTDAEDTRVLRRMKANYARSGAELMLRWREGAFEREHEPSGVVKAIENTRAERAFLACVDAAIEQRRALSDSKNASNYAPKVMASFPEADGFKQRDLEAAMNRLFNTRQIVNGAPFVRANRHPAAGIVRNVAPTLPE